MRLRALVALLVIAALPSVSSAANVFLWSTNTGQTVNPAIGAVGTNAPQSTPAARGMLLGINFNDGHGNVFTAVQDLKIESSGGSEIVQWQAPNYAADNSLPNDDVQTRSLALLVNADGQDQPPSASNFLREDSYWWDSNQTVGGQSRAWSPVATGIEGGEEGDDFMTMTATLGSVGQNTPAGVAKLIYVVTTGDLYITGTIARTSNPENATGVSGFYPPSQDFLFYDYETNAFYGPSEPSSFVLVGVAVSVLGVVAWRRRK